MGRISPLDQLISSSAFNDCSVTVIYSGVIITDVLLLCDGPSAPWPSLFCADVIVFFGTTPASLPVVLCIFVVPSSAQRTFASVAWLWETSHGVSWPRGLSNLTWETIAYSPPDQSQRSLLEPEKKTRLPSTFHASSLHSNGSIIYPYYQMCIHVWMWWVCMCPTRPTWNEKCMHMRMCAQTFWVPVFLILLVQTGNSPFLKSLVVRTLFVPHWNQETRSQPNDSFYLNGLLYSFTTTLYLSNS